MTWAEDMRDWEEALTALTDLFLRQNENIGRVEMKVLDTARLICLEHFEQASIAEAQYVKTFGESSGIKPTAKATFRDPAEAGPPDCNGDPCTCGRDPAIYGESSDFKEDFAQSSHNDYDYESE